MAESSHNSILLKKSNEEKLNAIITTFGKSEPNVLRFSELFYLLLDRCIFTNRLSFRKFVEIFDLSSKVVPRLQKKDSIVSQQGEPSPTVVPSQRHLTREQLVFFVGELGRFLYQDDKNYLERIFRDLLTQTTQADENHQMGNARVISLDETNKKLIVEQSITTIARFEKDIRALFNCYIEENYNAIKKDKRLLLTEREINLQNKRMLTKGLINFLREAEICPHVISIDHVEDSMRLLVPYTDNKENEYYHKHCLSDAYTTEEINPDKWKHVSDPGLMFFEFELLIARIAWESFPKDLDKKGIDYVLERFFQKVLAVRGEENQKADIVAYKKHLIILKQYSERYSHAEEVILPKIASTMLERDPRIVMAEKHEMEIDNMPMASADISEMLKVLEKELPKLPPAPKTKQDNPPPFKDEKIIIGQVPPPEAKQVDKGGKGQAKKDAGKKDEQPARVFPWATAPHYIQSSEDYFQQLATKLSYETQPISSLERGVLPSAPPPSLISETLFPPEMPEQVEPYLIGARTCFLDKNYFLTLDNYNKAYVAWKQFYKRKSEDFPQNIELYFGYMRGSVCASAGKDDHALLHYFNCRKHIEGGKLGFVNPDRALPYFGIGEMLFEVGEYEFAARAFLKARQIREGVLGIEHIQTATVFNNLGACFFMLGRATEALGYTQIAQAVFSGELGPYHQRTMTARLNLNKIKKGQFENVPQYRKLWEVYEKDVFAGGKKKKKAAAKKK